MGAKKRGLEVANALDLTSVSLWFARAIADMHQLTHPTFDANRNRYSSVKINRFR